MYTLAVLIPFVMLLLGAAGAADDTLPTDPYRAEIWEWREARLKRLTADDGYLTLAGLFWLAEGENTFGSDRATAIVLPPGSAPAVAGVLTLRDGTVSIRCPRGSLARIGEEIVTERSLQTDASGKPDHVEIGSLSFWVIKRGDRFAVRLRDVDSPVRREFRGIDYYPADPRYRVEARFEAFKEPKQLLIASVVGTTETMLCPGTLRFALDGKEQQLLPLLETPQDDSYFIIFKDETTGDETYGNGRFLYTSLPENGKVTIDFNKAYNPPCAFSPYTTCPLPPAENSLSVAVHVGEKMYAAP